MPMISYSAPTETESAVRPLEASATIRTGPCAPVTKNVMSPLVDFVGRPSTTPMTRHQGAL